MIVIISIIVGIILCTLGLLIYLRQTGFSLKNIKKTPLFLNREETIDYLGTKAKLTVEEKKDLEKLIALSGTNRLHIALDGAEVGHRWLLNTRKAIFQSISLTIEEKEQSEAALYEIFRKISVARSLLHPKMSHIKNISSGQNLEIKLSSGTLSYGDFVSGNQKQVLIVLNQEQFTLLKESTSAKDNKVLISFTKEMDGTYAFKGEIESLANKRGALHLTVTVRSPLKHSKLRLYPQRAAEIPVRFRIATDSEAQVFGALSLGLINRIGPVEVSILTPIPVPINTNIQIEFPLSSDRFNTSAVVQHINTYENIYALQLQLSEISQQETIAIYRFIYPDDSL